MRTWCCKPLTGLQDNSPDNKEGESGEHLVIYVSALNVSE